MENINVNNKEIISVKGLCKEYFEYGRKGLTILKVASFFAVKNVDLSISEGEFIAIMGPSGAGKSTLMNLISTIDTPTKGSVQVEGKTIKDLSQRKLAELRYKTIGFVFQDFNLLELLTNRENVAIALTLNDESKEEIDKKVLKIAQILNIESLLDKYPSQCSGGEQQRVATARALVAGPRILVADEPTGNLDSTNTKAVMNFFKGINADKGVTILMVTHDALVASYAKKVLYMRDGEIEKVIERGNKNQKDFFAEVLTLVSEDAEF